MEGQELAGGQQLPQRGRTLDRASLCPEPGVAASNWTFCLYLGFFFFNLTGLFMFVRGKKKRFLSRLSLSFNTADAEC